MIPWHRSQLAAMFALPLISMDLMFWWGFVRCEKIGKMDPMGSHDSYFPISVCFLLKGWREMEGARTSQTLDARMGRRNDLGMCS